MRYLGIAVLTRSPVEVCPLRASLVDCTVAAAFGMPGFIPRRLDPPLVPLMPGTVLRRILDEKFRTLPVPDHDPRRSSRSGPISNRNSSVISVRLRRRRNQVNRRSWSSRRTLS